MKNGLVPRWRIVPLLQLNTIINIYSCTEDRGVLRKKWDNCDKINIVLLTSLVNPAITQHLL